MRGAWERARIPAAQASRLSIESHLVYTSALRKRLLEPQPLSSTLLSPLSPPDSSPARKRRAVDVLCSQRPTL